MSEFRNYIFMRFIINKEKGVVVHEMDISANLLRWNTLDEEAWNTFEALHSNGYMCEDRYEPEGYQFYAYWDGEKAV